MNYIHREGYASLLLGGVFLLLINFLATSFIDIQWFNSLLQLVSLVLFGLLIYFFRNPALPSIAIDNNLIIAPAEGKVVVIEETEALISIDVNTGSHRNSEKDGKNFILAVNLEAAKEIAKVEDALSKEKQAYHKGCVPAYFLVGGLFFFSFFLFFLFLSLFFYIHLLYFHIINQMKVYYQKKHHILTVKK